jgi:hypothetical protein
MAENIKIEIEDAPNVRVTIKKSATEVTEKLTVTVEYSRLRADNTNGTFERRGKCAVCNNRLSSGSPRRRDAVRPLPEL